MSSYQTCFHALRSSRFSHRQVPFAEDQNSPAGVELSSALATKYLVSWIFSKGAHAKEKGSWPDMLRRSKTMQPLGSTIQSVHWHYLSSQLGSHSPTVDCYNAAFVNCTHIRAQGFFFIYMRTFQFASNKQLVYVYRLHKHEHSYIQSIFSMFLLPFPQSHSCFPLFEIWLLKVTRHLRTRWLQILQLLWGLLEDLTGQLDIHQQQQLAEALWCRTCSICCLSLESSGKDVVAVV